MKAGAGLVALCGVGGGVLLSSVDGRVPVLQVATPVPAGQKVVAEDLRTAEVAADSGVGLIPESQEDQIVGRVAAVPLVVGDLMTGNKVGASAVFPPVGQAVAPAELKAGSFPAELKAGDQVAVQINAPDQGTGPVSQALTDPLKSAMTATVVSVKDAQETGSVDVSLLTDEASAARIGQAGSNPVSVIVLAPGSAGGS
ncbi:SAF domain-containing protein [Catenulispora pinisilvae]|uniref:SAF domain-containing protein n=1 Tax=Catenulispora pinisilvae TaxID=2705253 RepID=UPI001891FA39|nr:SAF domain-containing protein [Catenulispora pinisilvae]